MKFDYEKKRWGIAPIENLITDFHGVALKFFLADVPSFLPGDEITVLDLGCGGGNILGFLKDKFPEWRVAGLDISSDALAIGRERFPKIEFIKAPAHKIPKADESIDLVTSFDSLEHFEELNKVLAEVRRVLKENGVFYISVPLEKQFPTLYWILYKLGWKGKVEFAGHVNFFDDHELEELLGKYDFSLVKRRFSGHLLFSCFDIPYYLSQSLLGRQATSFESSAAELEQGFKKSLLSSFKKVVSAASFFESSLLSWFPGGRGHFVFVKRGQKDFFSSHPPLTVLEDYQREFGLGKLIRPKDLAIKRHLAKLDFGKARKILDFGCGNGIWLERLLADGNAEGVGVDISEGLIEEANARVGRRGRYICTKEKRPLEDNSFDFCVSFDVFEHIEDKGSAVSEIFRALKPGGRFLFFTLNPNNKYTHSWLLEKLGSDYLYRWADHKKELFPDPKEFSALLEEQGFNNVGYALYAGPANLTWDIFCYLYLLVLEKLFSHPRFRELIRLVLCLNDFLVRLFFPLNNLIDSFFLARGYSNGYFIWGAR